MSDTSSQTPIILERLLEDYFSLQPNMEVSFLPLEFEPAGLPEKILRKSKFYDENRELISEQEASERVTPQGYPLLKAEYRNLWSALEAISCFSGVDHLRVCRAFRTFDINREFCGPNLQLSYADLQQFPILYIEGTYNNTSFWEEIARWYQHYLGTKTPDFGLGVPPNYYMEHYGRKDTFFSEDQDAFSKKDQDAVSKIFQHYLKNLIQDSSLKRYVDWGISKASYIPEAYGNIKYPARYPPQSRQFTNNPQFFLTIKVPRTVIWKDFLACQVSKETLNVYLAGPDATKESQLLDLRNLREEFTRWEEDEVQLSNELKKIRKCVATLREHMKNFETF